MLRLRVLELLEKNGKSKYWLSKHFDSSYQNFVRMISNETLSIRYSNIEKLCKIFSVTPNELFEFDFEKE